MNPLDSAILNNALWCDLVCKTHGASGVLLDYAWVNTLPSPRFYPNFITLTDRRDVAKQLDHIQRLAGEALPSRWAVKDSFGILDLRSYNFESLFETHWIYSAAPHLHRDDLDPSSNWVAVRDDEQLWEWELPWSRNNDLPSEERGARIFKPSLLRQPYIAILARCEDSVISAGAIVTKTQDVVGVSNVFGDSQDETEVWSEITMAIARQFPEAPQVGYESGRSLQAASQVGFESIGSLRVWQSLS